MVRLFQALNRIWPVALAIAVIVACAFLFKFMDTPSIVLQTHPRSEGITAQIAGAVKHPGVYTLDEGARLTDLLEAAGGLDDHADADGLNMARYIVDGEKLVIPGTVNDSFHAAALAAGESDAGSNAAVVVMESSDAGSDAAPAVDESSDAASDDTDDGESPDTASDAAASSKTININTATAEELCQLPGIGAVIAERIIEYRRDIPFMTREDITEVKGVGDALYEGIKDLIVTGNE